MLNTKSKVQVMSITSTRINKYMEQLRSGIILDQYHPTTLRQNKVMLSLSDDNQCIYCKKFNIFRPNKILSCM